MIFYPSPQLIARSLSGSLPKKTQSSYNRHRQVGRQAGRYAGRYIGRYASRYVGRYASRYIGRYIGI